MAKEEAKKLCFVIGPIGAPGSSTRTHADWLLEGIIEPVFREHFPDFHVERADKITDPGMIDAQIIKHLLDDNLVIADMTLNNANAFYEMGIRHMIGKPIIHMFLEGTEIPFDVKPYRAIPFKVDHPSNLKAAQKDLIKSVEAATASNHEVDNPVTRARGRIALDQHATPEQKIFLDKLEEMSTRIRELESINTSVSASNFAGSFIPKSRNRRVVFEIQMDRPMEIDDFAERVKKLKLKKSRFTISSIDDDRFRITFMVNDMSTIDFEQTYAELLELDGIKGIQA